MYRVVRCFVVLAGLLVLPSLALAQASLSGVVRDTSGAVLPGVTVEAASPVLIEKVRTAVTDNNGRYQMVDLRPGAYTITFTLAGFNTGKRDGVALSGSAASVVDMDLRVGSLEETITVTGEAPTVDVSTTSRSAVLSAETIDALPSSRNYASLARMIPAAVFNGTDVGGSVLQGVGGSVQIHGSRQQDQRVTLNGINTMTLQAGGNIGGQIPDVGSATEVTVDHTAVSAELPTGGVRINFIPRDGGNRFAAATFFTFTNGGLAGNNFTDELKAAGLDDTERSEEELGSQRLGGRADQAGQAVVLVLVALRRRGKLGTGGREPQRLQALGIPLCAQSYDARAAGRPFLQQQPAGDVAGERKDEDCRHLQAGQVVRLPERGQRRRWLPRRHATSASRC